MADHGHRIPDLPDEYEYPAALTEDYELLEVLSEREESQTLLVRSRKSSGTLCVAKCYKAGSPLFDLTEPETLRQLSSPLLPKFVADIRDEKMRCVLREYVPGETLTEVIRRGAMSQEETIRIGTELCDQLCVLHTQDPPVIHRDIKPSNVIMRPDGHPTLIDFGIARVHTEDSKEEVSYGTGLSGFVQSSPLAVKDREHHISSDTVILGTKGYAPPEQYGFSQTDVRSDIYSLGMLLQTMLDGEGNRKTKEENRTADSSKDDFALRKVLKKCCAFDPDNRYPDVMHVRKALQEALPESRKRKRTRTGILAAAAAIAAAVLAGIFLVPSLTGKNAVYQFAEPLIEEAARLNLNAASDSRITADQLAQVKALYIVSDKVLPDSDSFYASVNELYTSGGNFAHGPLASLEDLAAMPNLEQVCLAAEEIRDIEILSELDELNKVEIKHNYVEDITPLAGKEKLTSVGINDNPVEDISPLASCSNLAFLDLCDVQSYDPKDLSELGDFNYLDLSNPTESYRYLGSKNIVNLRLAWTDLTSLDVLDEVTGLEDLDISHTHVTDLTPLGRHTGLKRLNLTGLAISRLDILWELPQLEEVIMSQEMEPLMQSAARRAAEEQTAGGQETGERTADDQAAGEQAADEQTAGEAGFSVRYE